MQPTCSVILPREIERRIMCSRFFFKKAFALKHVQKQVLGFCSAILVCGKFCIHAFCPVDRGDAAMIHRAKCTNGEIFLQSVCISFNGDLKLYVNMPKGRIFSSTHAIKTSGIALSSCENTMKFNNMESTGFLFCVHPWQRPAEGSPCSKIHIKIFIFSICQISALLLHLQRKIMPMILL